MSRIKGRDPSQRESHSLEGEPIVIPTEFTYDATITRVAKHLN